MHLVAHVHLYYVFLASTRYCKGVELFYHFILYAKPFV